MPDLRHADSRDYVALNFVPVLMRKLPCRECGHRSLWTVLTRTGCSWCGARAGAALGYE